MAGCATFAGSVNLVGLQKILQNLGACKFVSITAETVPSLKSPKTNGLVNPDGSSRIVKRSKVTLATGDNMDYKSIVNGRLKKQGENEVAEVQPRKWGERVPNTPFVMHKGQLYLETLILGVSDTRYFLDGQEVKKSDIAQFLSEKPNSDTYDLGSFAPIWRDYKLANIREITTDKQTYQVC
jgi:hypothetical protein